MGKIVAEAMVGLVAIYGVKFYGAVRYEQGKAAQKEIDDKIIEAYKNELEYIKRMKERLGES